MDRFIPELCDLECRMLCAMSAAALGIVGAVLLLIE